MDTIIINLFGQPGAGKSTGAAYIFSKLKMAGVNAELVTEFAKDKVWEESSQPFYNQAYIFGEQSFRISRVYGKVDVIVTDSPILLSVIYKKDEHLSAAFDKFVVDSFNSFNNMNYFIKRSKPYSEVGRLQTESESDVKGAEILDMLISYDIPFVARSGDIDGYRLIVSDVLKRLGKEVRA